MSEVKAQQHQVIHYIVTVGRGEVGKSALILKFMYDEVGPYNKNNRNMRAVSEFPLHKLMINNYFEIPKRGLGC